MNINIYFKFNYSLYIRDNFKSNFVKIIKDSEKIVFGQLEYCLKIIIKASLSRMEYKRLSLIFIPWQRIVTQRDIMGNFSYLIIHHFLFSWDFCITK